MKVGEIVETCSVSFVAEGELHAPPPLGSLVKVQSAADELAYAVVSYAETAGLEPGRRAIRRGTEEINDADVYAANPQLRRVLRTVFRAVLVGGRRNDYVYQQLPALPQPLHYSVYACDVQEVTNFTDRLYYLRLLLDATADLPVSHLIIAHANCTYALRDSDREWLSRMARELAGLMKDENELLMRILYAIDPDG